MHRRTSTADPRPSPAAAAAFSGCLVPLSLPATFVLPATPRGRAGAGAPLARPAAASGQLRRWRTGAARGGALRSSAGCTRLDAPASTPPRASIFDGLFGGKKKDAAGAREEAPAPPPMPGDEEDTFRNRVSKYHDDVPVPFGPSLLAATFLEGRTLRCCYSAAKDGYDALDFHLRVDFKGPVVIVGKTRKGARFGAFNPKGWQSTDDYADTPDAFLFWWPEGAAEPEKLPKVGGPGAAIFDYARGGPHFGADGLVIGPPLSPVMGGFTGPEVGTLAFGDLREARSRLGLSYARRSDGADSLFGEGERAARLVEIDAFCCPEIAAMY
eukprot:tig00021374_g21110.t1